MLDNEYGGYQANAHDENENDLDDVQQDTSGENRQQCRKRINRCRGINEQLRGHRLRWHFEQINVESLTRRV